jgi:hypothetical protein
MSGDDLYNLLFSSLDLPEKVKATYLEGVMKKYGVSSDEITIEILREVVADLLQDTILDLDKSSADSDLAGRH